VYSCSGKKNQGRFRHVGSDYSLVSPEDRDDMFSPETLVGFTGLQGVKLDNKVLS
jgi:hypothetical protein